MNISSRFFVAVAFTAVLLINGIAAACPTCKDALAADANSANLVNGFGWSILFMMSMPFLILSGIGAYFYYEIRKARRSLPLAPTAFPPAAQATIS